ncbi:MAG: peptide deformylase [Candidatus Omnitrophica bacterium]|nr:peptide deformylase [Candidatus Omnitrophota bacterium]
MAILRIIVFPDSVLRKKAMVVTKINDEDRKLIKDMIDTMYVSDGVGLAAPQVGVSKRIFIANSSGERGKELVIVNPRILEKSLAKEVLTEGCLSLPGVSAEVKRSKKVVLKFEDLEGRERIINAEGILARIIQHETDHLDGVLFIDRIGALKRFRLLKKFKRNRR